MRSRVGEYCELTGEPCLNLKHVSYPGIADHQLNPYNCEFTCELLGSTSKIIMNILRGVRTCPWDLQLSCNSLAHGVSKPNQTVIFAYTS